MPIIRIRARVPLRVLHFSFEIINSRLSIYICPPTPCLYILQSYLFDHFVLYAEVANMNLRTAALLITALVLLSTVARGQRKFLKCS